MKRILVALALFTPLAGHSVWAQTTQTTTDSTDQSSLGNYARKVRKDTPSAKPKVFDNDNLPHDDKLSVVGNPTTDADAKPPVSTDDKDASGNKAAGTQPGGAQGDDAKKQAEWKSWQEKLAAQKNSIDLASRELDVLQKEYQLRAAAMYADVGNRLRNSTQWDKEDADYKQKIADKQKAVEDAKQKLDDMQEEARRAGVPAAMREP